MKKKKQKGDLKALEAQAVNCECGGFPQLKSTTGLILYYVQCKDCAKRTADYSTRKAAIEQWNEIANSWEASLERPIYLYYCKARLKTGDTVVVMQDNKKTFCKGVHYTNCSGDMKHLNSVGKAKGSGAKCLLRILKGTVYRL